ncbi:hypothetical protein SERLADRAFT_386714 [Serpula lacrymans var. lacrymans S7.9]|uniref:Uncharacterized protein n=1 Tax=Serpula lacrymans var. lacrymans (strain S7.9) TaxID=578457 RepID=F8NUB4_SERL9|nr:uncharacterized protein SERLADRAFT_386714 [Serpula lacrymans var. lacrymans S7.9]EGO25188.1 hypothetical protein SERLADRAFT_386714 [Serpula lacrymans var. lacrymans S7.9]
MKLATHHYTFAVRYGHDRLTSFLVQRSNITLNLQTVKMTYPLHCAINSVDRGQ